MLTLDGYRIEKRLFASSHSEVYAAVCEQDDRAVVLKLYPDSGKARAERELDCTQRCAGMGVPRVIEIASAGTRPVLVLERIRGATSVEQLERGPLAVEEFLALAVSLADILARVHAARILHRDVKPQNVLVDEQSRTWLIDFGCAATLGSAEVDEESRTHLIGTLPYMSPEATGRMDRGVDARSDLYSLGATFYHLLTGRPPFVSRDALELVHAHLAQLPEPPVALRPSLPATLSRIVTKLLQKEPDERYQSARALCDDLAACRAQLARGTAIADDFPLGTSDAPQRPLFQKRLYGREVQFAALCEGLERTARGSRELWLVKGRAGAGKSALAGDLRARTHAAGGYFASGKFDLYRDLPYSGWIAALESLLHQWLSEGATRLEVLRQDLLAALGNLAGALVELVPDARLVLGDVPPAPRVEGEQVRQRLALAVERFVLGCATPKHPLVLCLDDLQWADGGSLYLIEELMRASQGCLLLVGTYRDDVELDGQHPLRSTLVRLEAAGAVARTLELGPIGEESCAQMLADALQRSAHDTLPLARSVAHKTGNLPLLVQQFIEHIHELGLLQFVSGHGWVWDEPGIAATAIPDGAVALLMARIERLERPAQRALELASFIGDSFEAAQLAEIGGAEGEGLDRGLYVLCDEGLISPCRSGFRFVHDRIREAAQARVPEQERTRLHHRAARILYADVPLEARAERAFELADHFNRARSAIQEDERIAVCELNLMAAERALASGAPASAQGYLRHARELFREEDWAARLDLGTNLWQRSAACALQLELGEECLALLVDLERRPVGTIQSAAIIAQRIAVYALRHEVVRGAEIGLDALRALGVRWPLRPSFLRVDLAEMLLALRLGKRGADAFRPTTGYAPTTFARLLLVSALGGPASRVEPRLVALLSAWAVREFLRKGYTRGASLALAALAASLCRRARHVARARRYAAAAADLGRRVPDPVYRCRAEVVLHGSVNSWLMSRVRAVEPLAEVRQAALELGDREYSIYAAAERVYTLFHGGRPLKEVVREAEESLASAELRIIGVDVLRMLQEPSFAERIDAGLAAAEARHSEAPLLSTHSRIAWMLALVVLGRFADAFDQSERLGQIASLGSQIVDLTFLRGFSAGVLARSAGPDRRSYRRALRQTTRLLRAWARHGPDFEHMVEFLCAESAGLRGPVERAHNLYQSSARRAHQQGYIHHAALAHERAGELLLENRRETEGARELFRAVDLYEQWGAGAKVKSLRDRLRSLRLERPSR